MMRMDFPVALPDPLFAKARALNVRPQDVEERFVRGSGAGGQKINKTSSTVQLVHRPTGIEVRVQKHREQSKNRLSAWKLLILKIEEREKGRWSLLQQKIFKLRKQKRRRGRRAQEKVLDSKRQRGELKETRQRIV